MAGPTIMRFLFLTFLLVTSTQGYTIPLGGDPSSPSQALLNSRHLDFVVTHRTHPKEHFTRKFAPFPADHDLRCAGPDPKKKPVASHQVTTTHTGRGYAPDEAFYVCKNHMMTAMGDVSPYSVATFFPKREWRFRRGGTIKLSVNNSARRRRHWWELLLTPRSLVSVAAGPAWAPISEHYPREHVVFQMIQGFRNIEAGYVTPGGKAVVEKYEEQNAPPSGNFAWYNRHSDDPTMEDRRVRLEHRIKISSDRRTLSWSIKTWEGKWDTTSFKLKRALSFSRGIAQFKTHSYTPGKDKNTDDFTFHWSDISFSGSMGRPYQNYEAKDVVYMQRNGDSTVGKTKTVTIDVPKKCDKPVLFGQVHQPVKGEVILSINGRSQVEIKPYAYEDECAAYGWKSFQIKLGAGELMVGRNSFKWVIGKRSCSSEQAWIGYSIKSLEVQCDKGKK